MFKITGKAGSTLGLGLLAACTVALAENGGSNRGFRSAAGPVAVDFVTVVRRAATVPDRGQAVGRGHFHIAWVRGKTGTGQYRSVLDR